MTSPSPRPLRRKLAGLVLLVGVLVVGEHLISTSERIVPVEVTYALGAAPAARSFEALYVPHGGSEPVARFRTELIEPRMVHRTRLPPGLHDVRITVSGPAGDVRTGRTLEARRDARVTIDLSQELRP